MQVLAGLSAEEGTGRIQESQQHGPWASSAPIELLSLSVPVLPGWETRAGARRLSSRTA